MQLQGEKNKGVGGFSLRGGEEYLKRWMGERQANKPTTHLFFPMLWLCEGRNDLSSPPPPSQNTNKHWLRSLRTTCITLSFSKSYISEAYQHNTNKQAEIQWNLSQFAVSNQNNHSPVCAWRVKQVVHVISY